MDFLDLVANARSCRRFYEDRPLPPDTLTWLVSCARLAPSAKNQQVLRFAVVESPEACAALFPSLKWAGALKDWHEPPAGERPTGYLVFLTAPEHKGQFCAIDMGICGQTIQLAAASRQLGCCMFSSFDPRIVRQVLDLQEEQEVEPVLVMAFGLPKEERCIAPVHEDGTTTYWRDAQGVHYVPKRSLEAILVRRK